jgi:hypothetical protein
MHWLFNSLGEAIAVVRGKDVFDRSGGYLGELTDGEVWCGGYVGEIVQGNRFVRRRFRPLGKRGDPSPIGPFECPGPPGNVAPIQLQSEYQDLDWEL